MARKNETQDMYILNYNIFNNKNVYSDFSVYTG